MSKYRVRVKYEVDLFDFVRDFVVEAPTALEAGDLAQEQAADNPPDVYQHGEAFGGNGWALDSEGKHYMESTYTNVWLLDDHNMVVREIAPDEAEDENDG